MTDPLSVIPGHYPTVVRTFVCYGNHINAHDIAALEPSSHAIPRARLEEIRGESSMSWTAFAGVMDDGTEFSFGTPWDTAFFNMPPGYTADRLASVIPHRNVEQPVYRERPFFACFLNTL